MHILDDLEQELTGYPGLNWTRGDHWIRIERPVSDGFAVEVQDVEGTYTIFLGDGGWHRHFDDRREALEFIIWCYSGQARLREIWRGNMLQKSILEGCHDGSWREISVVGYVFVPFWKQKSEVVWENPNRLISC